MKLPNGQKVEIVIDEADTLVKVHGMMCTTESVFCYTAVKVNEQYQMIEFSQEPTGNFEL